MKVDLEKVVPKKKSRWARFLIKIALMILSGYMDEEKSK